MPPIMENRRGFKLWMKKRSLLKKIKERTYIEKFNQLNKVDQNSIINSWNGKDLKSAKQMIDLSLEDLQNAQLRRTSPNTAANSSVKLWLNTHKSRSFKNYMNDQVKLIYNSKYPNVHHNKRINNGTTYYTNDSQIVNFEKAWKRSKINNINKNFSLQEKKIGNRTYWSIINASANAVAQVNGKTNVNIESNNTSTSTAKVTGRVVIGASLIGGGLATYYFWEPIKKLMSQI
jgi:hypothetical protein